MDSILRATRDKIASAAQYRCEYCQTAQEISGAQMHIEHIIPLSRGGSSDESNLCLACAWCNSYKWVQTHGRDPETHEEVPLFDPRTQHWHEHFYWSENGVYIIGLTAIGRATVDTLKMNNAFIVPARRHWVEAGWHPLQSRAPEDTQAE
jgi:HNH endonuclease